MIKFNLIVLLVLLPLVVLAKPIKTAELEIKEIPISELSINEQINHYATLNGIEGSLIKKIVKCESEFKTTALGDGGRAYGLMQYHKASFERHAKLFGEELDYYSSHDQIKLGTFAISKGMGREWTSYRAIMNGGEYSFYSKLLQKNFTVRCK